MNHYGRPQCDGRHAANIFFRLGQSLRELIELRSTVRGPGRGLATPARAGERWGSGQADELRYTAFLSYSHKDAAAAGRLHRRLEAYRHAEAAGRGRDGARHRCPTRLVADLPRPRGAARRHRPQRDGARGARPVGRADRPVLAARRRVALGRRGDRDLPPAPSRPADPGRGARRRSARLLPRGAARLRPGRHLARAARHRPAAARATARSSAC